MVPSVWSESLVVPFLKKQFRGTGHRHSSVGDKSEVHAVLIQGIDE